MQILNNFGIQPTLLLAQIVNFLIILFLLKKFFYTPIIKVLDTRKKKIEESLKNADLIEEKLVKTEEQSKQIIEEAQKNAQALISDAKTEAERIINQTTIEARKSTEEALIEAKAQIEVQRQTMQKQLEAETLNLVVDVVKKVLGRNLKNDEKRQLSASAVREISKQIQ